MKEYKEDITKMKQEIQKTLSKRERRKTKFKRVMFRRKANPLRYKKLVSMGHIVKKKCVIGTLKDKKCIIMVSKNFGYINETFFSKLDYHDNEPIESFLDCLISHDDKTVHILNTEVYANRWFIDLAIKILGGDRTQIFVYVPKAYSPIILKNNESYIIIAPLDPF